MYLERKGKKTDQSGDFDTKSIGIKAENMDLAFQELINYSDPVGSIVREITSNCFDAHVEAGVDRPPLIRLSDSMSTSQMYIDFVDFGDGMSEDKIENIYGSLYESDKRNTNNKIGAFGIGSKSPLAYCDTYTLITVHNGIERQYWIYNHGQGFSITKYSEDQVDKQSGTTVRVPIQNDIHEVSKFRKAIKKQLGFFRKVEIEGFDIPDNEIVEAENFLVSKWVSEINKPTICLGEVLYELRQDLIMDRLSKKHGLRWFEIDDLNIGIKFEIGELEVTSKREDIKYTDDAIELIVDRIYECYKEVCNIIDERLKVDTFTDLLSQSKTGRAINIGNDLTLKIPMRKDDVTPTYTKYPDINCYSVIRGHVDKKRLDRQRLDKFPKVVYSSIDLIDVLKKIHDGLNVYYAYPGTKLNKTTSFVIVEREQVYPNIYTLPDENFVDNIDELEENVLAWLRHCIEFKQPCTTTDIKNCTNKLQQVKNLLKEVKQYIIDNGIHYHSIVPTEDEIERKKKIEEKDLWEKEQDRKSVNIKFLTYFENLEDSIKFKTQDFWPVKTDLGNYFRKTGLIIYGFSEDREKLIDAFTILMHLRMRVAPYDDGEKLVGTRVISISKKNAKKLKEYYPDKAMHVDEYMKGIHSTFRKVMTWFHVQETYCFRGQIDARRNEMDLFDDTMFPSPGSQDLLNIRKIQERLSDFTSQFRSDRGFFSKKIGDRARRVYYRYREFYDKHNLWYPNILHYLDLLVGYSCKYPVLMNTERKRRTTYYPDPDKYDVEDREVLQDNIEQYVNIVPNKHVHPRFFKPKHLKAD